MSGYKFTGVVTITDGIVLLSGVVVIATSYYRLKQTKQVLQERFALSATSNQF